MRENVFPLGRKKVILETFREAIYPLMKFFFNETSRRYVLGLTDVLGKKIGQRDLAIIELPR
jgi:hypothetical protein